MKLCPKINIRPPCPSSPLRSWSALAPADHELTDVLSPYWLGSRTSQYQVGDIITILDESQRFFAHLQLTEVHDAAVSFVVLQLTSVTPANTIRPDFAGAEVGRRAGTWAVAVGDVVIKKFANEAEARSWLRAKQVLYAAAQQGEA